MRGCSARLRARAVLRSRPWLPMFGGIVGQEVVKACSGKFHPLFQVSIYPLCQISTRTAWLFFVLCCLADILIRVFGTHPLLACSACTLGMSAPLLQFFYFNSLEFLLPAPMTPYKEEAVLLL